VAARGRPLAAAVPPGHTDDGLSPTLPGVTPTERRHAAWRDASGPVLLRGHRSPHIAACRRTPRDRIRRRCDASLVWGFTSVGERAAPLGSRAPPPLVLWSGTYHALVTEGSPPAASARRELDPHQSTQTWNPMRLPSRSRTLNSRVP
jgi:hypothetical protein